MVSVNLSQVSPDKIEEDTDIDLIAIHGSGSRQYNATTPPRVQSPACVGGFPMTADLPTPSAISIKASSGNSPDTVSYRYSSLPEGCIRLLRLMPHRNDRSRIQCQLFEYPLLDSGKGTHLYEALSYVWGSNEKSQFVFTDKGYIPVTTNLHMALTRLRDCSLGRVIWADAICINQDDTEERNSQVQSMAKIYAGASRVIVWLEEATTGGARVHGEAITDSDRALEGLRMAAGGQPTEALASETDQQAILTLLQRSWFQRIWVRQSSFTELAKVVDEVVSGTSGSCCSSTSPDYVSFRGD